MSCDFKPGDELEAIKTDDHDPLGLGLPDLVVGKVYVCEDVWDSRFPCSDCDSTLAVAVGGVGDRGGYCPCAFRKVQKRDIGESLKQATTYDEEQHAPAPTTPARKRERA